MPDNTEERYGYLLIITPFPSERDPRITTLCIYDMPKFDFTMCKEVLELMEQLDVHGNNMATYNYLKKRQILLCQTLTQLMGLGILALRHLGVLRHMDLNCTQLEALTHLNTMKPTDEAFAHLDKAFKHLEIDDNAFSKYKATEVSNSTEETNKLLQAWDKFQNEGRFTQKPFSIEFDFMVQSYEGSSCLPGFRRSLWSVNVETICCYIKGIELCLHNVLQNKPCNNSKGICKDAMLFILDLGATISNHDISPNMFKSSDLNVIMTYALSLLPKYLLNSIDFILKNEAYYYDVMELSPGKNA